MNINNPVKHYLPPDPDMFNELCGLVGNIKRDDLGSYSRVSRTFVLIHSLRSHPVIERFIHQSAYKKMIMDADMNVIEMYGGVDTRKALCPDRLYSIYCYFSKWFVEINYRF